jgi:hypothetical protein
MFVKYLHSPLYTSISIVDKFIVRYNSPCSVSTESESIEPGKKKTKTMCQQCSDNRLSFGFSGVVMQHVRFLSVLCVEKNNVMVPSEVK